MASLYLHYCPKDPISRSCGLYWQHVCIEGRKFRPKYTLLEPPKFHVLLMSFDKCRHSCNCYHNKNVENSYHLIKFSHVPLYSILSSDSQALEVTELISVPIVLPFAECYMSIIPEFKNSLCSES